MNPTTTTVTIIETGAPSRSKQAGPCWIAVGDIYAATTPRAVDAEVGDIVTVTGKATLGRRSGGSDVARRSWDLRVTGDETDTVDLSVGSPQSVDAHLTGVVRVES